MPTRPYPRGSEWRKWDLHVHTPYSVLNNGFGQGFDTYAKSLLLKALEFDIHVVGITDYFQVRGYREMKGLLDDDARLEDLLGPKNAQLARGIVLIPNVELRSSVVVTTGKSGRVNYHVLFDPELGVTAIEEYFLRQLKFTALSNPSAPDERWALTEANLADFGRRLKSEHDEFSSEDDLVVGMMNAVIAHEDVTRVLEEQRSRFLNRYLLVVAGDEDLWEISWDGQGHQTRKLFIQKAHMLFSGNPGTRDFGLGRRHESEDAFVKEFRSLKPCIHGSDAHDLDSLFRPDLGRQLWIKADPTFQGLRQLLFEPEARVYLGQTPSAVSLAREKATRYMSTVTFSRTGAERAEARWFSGTVPLNQGLVAIIGNKGSGKSALSDVLGLLGNTSNSEFSFLTFDRFLSRKSGLGSMFAAEAEWLSGDRRQSVLDSPVNDDEPELVQYIPQHFLEKICSELRDFSESEFDRELMGVIYSHVAPADKLGRETLPDLIAYKTEEAANHLQQLQDEIRELNLVILELEEQATNAYRNRLEKELAQRTADLAAHDAAKPHGVPEPSTDPDEQARQAAVKEQLDVAVHTIGKVDLEIEEAKRQAADSASRMAAADRLSRRIENLERTHESFHAESDSDGALLSLDTRSFVALAIDRTQLDIAVSRAGEHNSQAKALLSESPDSSESLIVKRQEADKQAAEARAKLDEPTRLYEEAQRRLLGWQKTRDDIEGNPQIRGSVDGLKAKISGLNTVPSDLSSKRERRDELVSKLYAIKTELLANYQDLYSPVQRFIDNHPVAEQRTALQFSAAISVDNFGEQFLQMIHQGRRGSFQSDREGPGLLGELLDVSDFSSLEGINAFLAEMEDMLRNDRRVGADRAPIELGDQLRQGWGPEDVYDFLYGMEYLQPRFELLWQGKPLDQLSPGERGNILLVFYLLIDKRDSPLLIDQPEENLDNHTIATALIPALKHAKDRRQIIIVTHNPNLAVVCDAEEIIHAEMDKTDGNRVTYTSGSIEDPEMARRVVDVLEGTKPAFDIRGLKYDVVDRLGDVTAT